MKIKSSNSMYNNEKILTVIFLAVEKYEGFKIVHYFHNESQDWAVITNREILCERLIKGSSIRILFREKVDCESSVKYVKLLIEEHDLLPEDLIPLLTVYQPAFRASFGFISDPSVHSRRYYLVLKGKDARIRFCTGEYSSDGTKGECRSFDGEWEIRQGLIENYFLNQYWPASPIKEWVHGSFSLTDTLEYLTIDVLNREFRNYVAENRFLEFFHSDDWSPEFYRAQALLGFIAITANRSGSVQLVPQLQSAYAILDWNNLIIDKKVKNILKGKRLKNENIRLIIDSDPEIVLNNLKTIWKGLSWLSPQYNDLIIKLASEEEQQKDRHFRIWGVTLTVGEERFPIAGELGYTIGRTYTSLSGFFKRDMKEYNNFGKLQLVMLSQILKDKGIEFWNLGHPHMKYKTDMGAVILPREEFLERWDTAIKGNAVDLSGTFQTACFLKQ